LIAALPLPAGFVERVYSGGLYPILQPSITAASNLSPVAVGDLLVSLIFVALCTWWILRIKKARGHRLKAVGYLTLNTLVCIAILYLGFMLLWGFNYQRRPLKDKLDYDEQRYSEEKRQELCITAIKLLNDEATVVHGGPWPAQGEWQPLLRRAFDEAVTSLGTDKRVGSAAPKTSLFDAYFGATGITGFTNPFGLEVILNSELLPTEQPFTLAHEWAHIAGFADESEANFVGLIACARSESPAIRYSAWLGLFHYLPFRESERPGMGKLPPLSPEVRADLRAIDERIRKRLSPRISEAQGKVYDQFLRANRVEGGILSYGLVARLLLATRFEPDWVPSLRGSS
jgi:hypothetical protein